VLRKPARRLLSLARRPASLAPTLHLNAQAPSPSRLDIEITNRCDQNCPRCARTLYSAGSPATDLDPDHFASILEFFPFASEVIFVGLGEPLLHPEVERLVALATQRGRRSKLVTNGCLATPERLTVLRNCGLAEVTFSIDTLEPVLFRHLRGGASLETVLDNFRRVPPGLERTMFVTVSRQNLDSLPGLIDLAADMRLPGFGVSDVNFPENQPQSLHAHEVSARLAEIIRHAARRGVMLVGPHLHNLGLQPKAFPHIAVRLPSDLSGRSRHHRRCLAPWRIAVINSDGSLSPCNCAPTVRLRGGRLPDLWNSAPLWQWRQTMLAGDNPSCWSCPRY
jgi:MoaA/NifB/PqqE/SkfB family radical SAM enzyme